MNAPSPNPQAADAARRTTAGSLQQTLADLVDVMAWLPAAVPPVETDRAADRLDHLAGELTEAAGMCRELSRHAG